MLSVINTKLLSVSSQDRKQLTIDELNTKEKGKILSLLALFAAKTSTNVRKSYPVTVLDTTLALMCFLALKVAFELVQ